MAQLVEWIAAVGGALPGGVWVVWPLAVLAGLAVLGVYATQVEPYRPVLRRVRIEVPAEWPSLSILHLSDLHVCAFDGRLYRAQERFLRSVGSSDGPGRTPDLVCVTGDVCERLVDAPRVAALLVLVRPRVETLLVLGNHEHDARMPDGVRRALHAGWRRLERLATRLLGRRPKERHGGLMEARAIAETLGAAGVRVLTNEGVRVDIDGRSVWVAGSDSIWAGRAHAAEALNGREDGEPCLALVHEPEGAPALIARGASLALAGHTHGGQVVFPLLGPPYTHRTDPRIRVAAGLQRLGRGMLHISAGLGHTTPLRFNCPPEATWIECVPVVGGEVVVPSRVMLQPVLAVESATPGIEELAPEGAR